MLPAGHAGVHATATCTNQQAKSRTDVHWDMLDPDDDDDGGGEDGGGGGGSAGGGSLQQERRAAITENPELTYVLGGR